MTVYDASGNVLSKAELEARTTVVTQEPVRRIDETVYETYNAVGTRGHFESERRLLFHEGQVVTQKEFDRVFPSGSFTSIEPASGALGGGDDVTITGVELSGTESVTIGGVPCTNVEVVDDETVTCTTPAGTAGPKDVVVMDDAGNLTGTGAFTYV